MIKPGQDCAMSVGLILVLVVVALMALAPLLTRASDLDDRDRRGWWSKH
jgi:hypothetical protein